ncbi:outer membrane protein TolC [Chitinophaga niastensis]|uniref:Outer membrane protein TolC n=1 Tax=Chitinophaga niastensis TaxID=536980 RepID=A0A2P8H8E1_CHINA|nr:TolC family protein [Chitinophaga niastensis]PSL42503.1 outer membrane protein TolC [Chitinophaga niastensis]
MRYYLFFIPLLLAMYARAQQGGKELTLKECYQLAKHGNTLVQQAARSLQAREYSLQAENRSYYPKIDLLAGYNYLGKPLEINLQQVKDGVVNGSSAQSVNTANTVYQQITGQPLPQHVQDVIYNATKGIVNTLYPNYNPTLAKQSYFMAGLGLRQPIYLGGKISAAQDLARTQVTAGQFNQQVVEKGLYFAISAQYLRILYLNTIMAHEAVIVSSFQKNRDYATSLKDNQILPPYLLNWARVALIQATNRYSNLELEKENALLELNNLLGQPLETPVFINDTLQYENRVVNVAGQTDFYQNNPTYRLIESKTALANVAVKASRSLSLPNIFAIGNLNLYQKDLPITIPPWLIGVEMQWNLFDGFQKYKRTKASKMLVEEARMAAANTKTSLELQLHVAMNKMKALQNDVASLDSARQQAHTTTTLITDRMQNQLSSVKDVNDALLQEEEMEKIYYTAVMGYYLALAEYWNVVGTPEQFATYVDR